MSTNCRVTKYSVIFFIFYCLARIGSLTAGEFGQLIYEVVGEEIHITKSTDLAAEVVIPNTIDALPVTVIGTEAFISHKALKKISFPSSLLKIGKNAFSFCSSLESLDLPQGLKEIESGAFRHCIRIQSIKTPASLQSIGKLAFTRCQMLQNVILDGDSLILGEEAFSWNQALKSVVLEKGLSTISTKAFQYCHNLIDIEIREGIGTIGFGSFSGCAITELDLPSSLTTIHAGGLTGLTKLLQINVDSLNSGFVSIDGVLFSGNQTQLHAYPSGRSGSYEIPYGVTGVSDWAFSDCYNLDEITLSSTVNEIGDSAFNFCYKLATLRLNDGLLSIGDSAFAKCASLNVLEVPESVQRIGMGAFYDCENLEFIRVLSPLIEIGNVAFKQILPNGRIEKRKEVIIPAQFHDYDEAIRIGLGSPWYFKTPLYADVDSIKIILFHNILRSGLLIVCHSADTEVGQVTVESSINPNGPWTFLGIAKLDNGVGSVLLESFDLPARFFRHSNRN